MLDSLRPFVIPALSAKGQKLAFVTRGPFSCRRRRRRHGRGAGRHKSGEPCMRAGSNAQAWAGRGTGTQIIRTGTVFQCAPAAADPAAAARGELTEVGAERVGSALGGNFSSGGVHRAAVIPPRAKFCWLAKGAVRSCIWYTASTAHNAKRQNFTSWLCGRRGSDPCTPAHGSRYGRCRIFSGMHVDVHRFCSGCILLWRISVCAAV